MVLTNSLRLIWTDVCHLFPPKRDVERILDYFLREMVYIMVPVQETQFARAWSRLIHPQTRISSPSWMEADEQASSQGISRSMVGSLLFCLASTSYLIPQRREEELGLSFSMADYRDEWITSALALVRSGTVLSAANANANLNSKGWLHYVDSLTDTSLDRFAFETLAVRIFALLGMSEVAYHLNGECLRRAIRINLFDEGSPKAAELFTVDDPDLTPDEVMEMRRRIATQMVVTERWTCLYTGRPPMIDEEANGMVLPKSEEEGGWKESEQVTWGYSRFVSRLRLLPGQLTALTTRKAGDWATQRARDQEAVNRVLELDRGLCNLYDPSIPRASLNNRSHSQILAELPLILERNEHLSMSESEVNRMHREFSDALVMTSSWLSLRCLVNSNLMFLPWVQDYRERYYALNLARRLIELLPSIWMMAKSPYVPFSSSWISRHLFLACTVLSVPILGQEASNSHSNNTASASKPTEDASAARTGGSQHHGVGGGGGVKGDFAPSNMQKQHVFNKLNPTASKVLSSHSQLPASNSIDLDWFSGKLVEIASLFSKLAERGDQTSGVNTKLIHALLNSRAELRDRVLDKLGQKQQCGATLRLYGFDLDDGATGANGNGGGGGGGGGGVGGGGSGNGQGEGGGREGMGRIESQKDLTSFVMATTVGKSSPSSNQSQTGMSPASIASPNRSAAGGGRDTRGGGEGFRAKGRGGSNSTGGGEGSRRDVVNRERLEKSVPSRVQSPSLYDLADAVDKHTKQPPSATANRNADSGSNASCHNLNHHQQYHSHSQAALHSPSLPSFSPTSLFPPPAAGTQSFSPYTHSQQQHVQQQDTSPAPFVAATTGMGVNAGAGGWEWAIPASPSTAISSAEKPFPTMGIAGVVAGSNDVLANVPLLLDTHDWLAILDGVDIPL